LHSYFGLWGWTSHHRTGEEEKEKGMKYEKKERRSNKNAK
jgi:hypothetical protein